MARCGLYVHIPYCVSKCGYCDFYSVEIAGRDVGPLVEALVTELRGRVRACTDRIETVFMGGGTPTTLPLPTFRFIMAAMGEVVQDHRCLEFTVEANPGTVDSQRLEILVEAGMNRLSLGGQSFLPSELLWLERDHSPEEIAPAVALARRYGIKRINLDLIFGIGGQTMATWDTSLSRALDLGVDHLACYGLTYEPGTRLDAMRRRGEVKPCDEGLEADMYLHAIDRLAAAGYEQYEISNFAQPGQRCQHNLIYWLNEPYIGVGPSAAGYRDGTRYKNISSIREYTDRIGRAGEAVAETERLDATARAGETIMLQLRMTDGIHIDRFVQHTGVDPRHVLAEPLARMEREGLVTITADSIRLTRRGLLVADAIIADLMVELDRCDSVPIQSTDATAVDVGAMR
ncbi:MAG: radical SAM family heme chaperone HemW [Planctomycetes bacterium]|nr:radical SAM family heme chaperone HemW [Planctomycetota bacterium]